MSMEHIFRQWIGMHRAMIAWFHAAHHVTKGTGFGGDHVNLYGEIYTKLDEDLDGIIEKGIGLTGDETLADPVSSLSLAATLLSQQPASANQSAETIASNAFEVIKYYVAAIESTYAQFEAASMSLGLDDLLQGLANQYETYVYLLQQRSRTVSLQKENNVKITKTQLRKIISETMHDDGQSNMIGPVNLTYIHQQIDEKMEHDLLAGIQDTVADAMNDPMSEICDYGAEAESLGYGDLMEQVAQWFEDYIAHCVNQYRP